jgi:hypothetical protein
LWFWTVRYRESRLRPTARLRPDYFFDSFVSVSIGGVHSNSVICNETIAPSGCGGLSRSLQIGKVGE